MYGLRRSLAVETVLACELARYVVKGSQSPFVTFEILYISYFIVLICHFDCRVRRLIFHAM